jgi:spermidine synthase
MAATSALVLHLGSPFSHPDRVRQTLANLREVFPIVAPYFVHIPLYGSIWGFACASDTLDPRAIEPAEADRRLAARGVGDLQYYNGETHCAVFALPNYIRRLVAAAAPGDACQTPCPPVSVPPSLRVHQSRE